MSNFLLCKIFFNLYYSLGIDLKLCKAVEILKLSQQLNSNKPTTSEILENYLSINSILDTKTNNLVDEYV